MPRTDRLHLAGLATTALAAAFTASFAVLSGMPACITAPPPELPEVPLQPPRILHNSVVPAADQDLTELPPDGSFIVPVVLNQPQPFGWQVFVDFYPDGTTPSDLPNGLITVPDGGTVLVSFTLLPTDLIDPTACHWIQFSVGAVVQGTQRPPVWAAGSDSVVWRYVPNGPDGCEQYDAGDGAPLPDGPTDGPLLTPPDGIVR
jgi:hypothetical protein